MSFSESDHAHHQWKDIRKHLMGLSESDPQWQKRHLMGNTNFFSEVKKAGKSKPGFLSGGDLSRPGFLRKSRR